MRTDFARPGLAWLALAAGRLGEDEAIRAQSWAAEIGEIGRGSLQNLWSRLPTESAILRRVGEPLFPI